MQMLCWKYVRNALMKLCLAFFFVTKGDGNAGVKLRYDEDMMSMDSSVTLSQTKSLICAVSAAVSVRILSV